MDHLDIGQQIGKHPTSEYDPDDVPTLKIREIVRGYRFSVDPFALDVSYTDGEQARCEDKQESKVERKRQVAVLTDRGLEDVRPIGKGQNVRERLQKEGQRLDGDEQAAEKDHRKTEEVGEGLRLEDFFDCHSNKKTEKGRSKGNQEDGTQYGKPANA